MKELVELYLPMLGEKEGIAIWFQKVSPFAYLRQYVTFPMFATTVKEYSLLIDS